MSTNLKDRLSNKLTGGTAETTDSAKEPGITAHAALPPVESSYVALTNNALEIIGENLKNQQLSYALFDVVKSPSGGTTAFTVPGLSGDEIELEKATSKTGQPYALYNFEAVNTLSPEETATAKAFGQKFLEILNSVPEQDLDEVA